MNDGRPLVGIDVGSSTVSVVVALPEGDELVVHGCGQARHDGARKGVIANLEEVTEAVRAAAEEAEAMAVVPVEEAIVGIGGTAILGMPATASVPITGRHGTVTPEDQARALHACARVAIPADYRVLSIVPCGFAVDGQGGVQHAVGICGTRLEAQAFVLYAHKTVADTVEQAVNRAGIAVSELVHEPLAAAESVLSRDERDLGCLLLDIGHGSTEWVIFAEGVVVASGASPVAGRIFTSDLAVVLKTATAEAERVKRRIGADLHREGLETEALELSNLGGDGRQVHAARFAAEILYERARDLLVDVHRGLERQGLERLPRAGLILTGGGARLDGLPELAEQIFGHRVRLGTPRGLSGLVEPVDGPEWSVACGLVTLAHQRRIAQTTTSGTTPSGLMGWLRHTLGEFFELGGGA